MSVYNSGKDATPRGKQINADQMTEGEYVFTYESPVIVYKLFSAEFVAGTIKGWLDLKKWLADKDPSNTGQDVFEVTGVQINTDTGIAYVRCHVYKHQPQYIIVDGQRVPMQVQESGVDYRLVVAGVVGLFAVIGVYGVMKGIYSLNQSDGSPADCSGFTGYFRCLAQKGGWVAVGLGIGTLLTLLAILLLVGRGSLKA